MTFVALRTFHSMLVPAGHTSASTPVMLTLSALDVSLRPGHSGAQVLKTFIVVLSLHCLYMQHMLCIQNKLLLVPG